MRLEFIKPNNNKIMLYNKNLKIFSLVLCLGFFSLNNSFAEIIVLKSGKTVEGKITNTTKDYTEVEFMGVKLKYLNDQIAEVKKSPEPVESAAEEPELITIKIKGSPSANSQEQKEEGAKEFIEKLDGLNSKIDSVISDRMNKIPKEMGSQVTEEQKASMKSILSLLKEKETEITKAKAPSGCKALKEAFLKLFTLRVSTLEDLMNTNLSQIEVAKILEKRNTDIANASNEYVDERQRALKQAAINK